MYFRNIIGLYDVKKQLINSVHEGFVPHARMFYGPEGVGKLPLAIAYARYLNCSNRGAEDACGECPSCHKFDKLAHPDLHFVFPVVKSKVSDEYLPEWRKFLSENTYFNINQWLSFIDAQNAQGVIYSKESDEIIRKLNLKIYEAPYKIMILWLPEKMHDSCANKLLKLLEEPPGNTVFLLVSEDRENVLQTIWSRCQPLHIRAIEKEEMVIAIQQNFGLERESAVSVAHIANGSFTNAVEIISSSDTKDYLFDLFKSMMRSSVSGNIKSIKEISNKIAGIGREMQKGFLLYSLRLFREYFVSNLNEPDMVYLQDDEWQFGNRFAPFINEKNIEEFNNEFSLAFRQIEQNGNAKIIFLDLCLKVTLLLRK
ncbi:MULTISPECIES: ATP-binding protein [Proteiniphilum]|jgi:DNA polymerase-3 subunit delta'|uniref:DNA polymerase III subunit n=1 Tax=Proteiniphilum TaxID=294702 RepID=UPI001EEBABA7|nr:MULTISPECIES: DNA polymerase III subunit [Proteiniphilum]ULB34390.1 DNA polymerase III subunit [Proteiniphilum propionicum]